MAEKGAGVEQGVEIDPEVWALTPKAQDELQGVTAKVCPVELMVVLTTSREVLPVIHAPLSSVEEAGMVQV